MSIAALVRRNWLDTEMRVDINQRKVEQYAEEKKEGAYFPVPVVFIEPKSETFLVGDGFHRILAEQKNGAREMQVEVRRGVRLDAVLFNIEANRSQRGLPFSTGDKQKCILTLAQDPVAGKWTQNRICETVGCSPAYVSLTLKNAGVQRPTTVVDKTGRVLNHQHKTKDREGVKERRQKVFQMWRDGRKCKEIAEELHIGHSTVSRDLQEASMTSRMVECPHCKGTGYILEE